MQASSSPAGRRRMPRGDAEARTLLTLELCMELVEELAAKREAQEASA